MCKKDLQMPSEKETQIFLEALFNFKSNLYTQYFQRIQKSGDEQALRAFLDTASRFTIDLYDVIDHATRDSLKENDIAAFWKHAKKTIEHKMDGWIQDTVKATSSLNAQSAKLRTDIREFQERAVKFHMERQAYTFQLRKAKVNEITAI